MQSEQTAGSRLDVHLPDGGHVYVAVEVDGDGSDDAELAVATAVVFGGDNEPEVVTAVEAVVAELGLTVASSRTNRANRTREIVIR
jgi:ethanolamine utilization microcompartment shell protein EutL